MDYCNINSNQLRKFSFRKILKIKKTTSFYDSCFKLYVLIIDDDLIFRFKTIDEYIVFMRRVGDKNFNKNELL